MKAVDFAPYSKIFFFHLLDFIYYFFKIYISFSLIDKFDGSTNDLSKISLLIFFEPTYFELKFLSLFNGQNPDLTSIPFFLKHVLFF